MAEVANADAVALALAACTALASPWTLLIDGRSGAGKSTLADALVAATSAQFVRLDDVYPGWDGLEAGASHVRRHLLSPRARGAAGRWQRWDWGTGLPAEWHEVAAERSLIVEGCGVLGGDAPSWVDLRIWVDLPADARRRRALARDGDLYRSNWDRWAVQEESYLAREHPVERADLVLSDPGFRTSGRR